MKLITYFHRSIEMRRSYQQIICILLSGSILITLDDHILIIQSCTVSTQNLPSKRVHALAQTASLIFLCI
jgi:hypothetical protein